MRATHKLTQRKHASVDKAIRAHEAYTNYIVGKVEKIGVEEVLTLSEHKKLRSNFMKLLKFAETCMIKQLPTEFKADMNVTGNAYTDRILDRLNLVTDN